jgi:DNA-binding MarR family transcriptional regulator
MKSYSPRLQVSLDEHELKKAARVFRDVKIVNVVAVLPGTTQKDRHVIISGHYDSLHIVRKKVGELEQMDQEATVAADAPGVSQIDIAGLLTMDRPTTMAIVNRLQDRGLVERRASARDRRRQELHLTSEGADFLEVAAPRIADHRAMQQAEALVMRGPGHQALQRRCPFPGHDRRRVGSQQQPGAAGGIVAFPGAGAGLVDRRDPATGAQVHLIHRWAQMLGAGDGGRAWQAQPPGIDRPRSDRSD